MLDLTWWWALWLIPLPLIARRLLPHSDSIEVALHIPLLQRYPPDQLATESASTRLAKISLWCFWICLVLAACRPFWLGEPTHRVINGRDIMLAIDISGSMQETDMRIGTRTASRIDVLKSVVTTFIERRQGDRLGLILFGTRAYTYVPLTFDRKALSELLADVSSGLAGRLTAIGDAIGVAVKTLDDQTSKHKVLILVTDGSNTSGANMPLNAARIAAHQGMTIYTIGVGNDAEAMRELLNQKNIAPGTELNETLLRQIAAISGGQYFRARDSGSLERIYQTLDRLEPVELGARLHRPKIDLSHLPLGLGLAVMFFFMGYQIHRSIRLKNTCTV